MRRSFIKPVMAITTAVLMVLAWWLWPDSRLDRVRELQHELFGEAGRAMSPDVRQSKFGELRTELAILSPAQRSSVGVERCLQTHDRIRHYFEMSAEEKRAFLDQHIDRPPPTNIADDCEHSRQHRLDRTTPEFRAFMDVFRRDLEARRAERGMAVKH